MTKVGQAFTSRSLRGAQTNRSILNALTQTQKKERIIIKVNRI